MKLFYNYLFFFLLLSQVLFSQETVYLEAEGQTGRGILKSRSGECFVITPKHVVEESNKDVNITGLKNVLSKGKLIQSFSDDLAVVRITSGGQQKCDDWALAENFEETLANSFEGFLEVKSNNGSNKLIKVLLTEKENSYITIRPYFQDEKLVKGLSGSSLFCTSGTKKVFMGLLMLIDENGKGIVLQADAIDKVLGSFFSQRNNIALSNNPTEGLNLPLEKIVEENGYKIEFISCKKTPSRITVKLLITSLEKDSKIGVSANNGEYSAKIYDQSGREYIAENVKLSTFSGPRDIGLNYTMVRGIQIPLEFIFKEVSDNSVNISLFRFFFYSEATGITEVKFKNISLSSTFTNPDAKGIQSISQDGFEIQLMECKKKGSTLICKVMLKSLLKDIEILAFANQTESSTKIYDQAGREYIASNVRLSTFSDERFVGSGYTLVKGVQVPLEFTFKDVSENTSGISLLRFYIFSQTNGHLESKFNNISLSSAAFTLPHINGIQRVIQNGFEIQLVECRKTESSLVCKVMLKSLLRDIEIIAFANETESSTKLYDQSGREYIASNVGLSTFSNERSVGLGYTLVKGVQVPLEFTFIDIPENLSSVSLLHFYIFSQVNGHTELKFRKIPLS